MKVVWSEAARDDFALAREWFALGGPSVARAWSRRIRARIALLARFPASGPTVIAPKGIRHVVVGYYRIFYRIEATEVRILRLRDSRRPLLHPEEIGEFTVQYELPSVSRPTAHSGFASSP